LGGGGKLKLKARPHDHGRVGSVIKRIHHVGIAVRDLEEALRFFSGQLGLEVAEEVVVEEHGMRAAWLEAGNLRIELMEPLGPEGPIARFLEKRGEGVHHVALEVEDIASACEELRRAGAKLVYPEARVSRDGSLYNFVHPKSAHGVLLELVQRRAKPI